MQLLLALPAPAKLNLFLHVTGRRADGYHELQTAYALIDLADLLDFECRLDGAIERVGDLIGSADADLAVRAAVALKQVSGTTLGVTIGVAKRIPAGSGMGGGSSDAATTLIALNRLWDLHLPRAELSAIGLTLGADVPFFLHGHNAYAEGIGERLTTFELPPAWFAIIWPRVHVSTRDVFNDPSLTPHSKATKMAPHIFTASQSAGDRAIFSLGVNDLEPVARRRYPAIEEAIEHLQRSGAARMTGSGSAVFAATPNKEKAELAIAGTSPHWSCWAARGLNEHPLSVW